MILTYFLAVNTQKEITKILNNELKLLFEWLCANRLSLNVDKTEFIVFRPPKRQLNQRIVLKLNGTKIYESQKIKYLGVILDPRLCWNHHINELSKKLNRAIGMIYKIRCDCTKEVLLSLYFSIFHSHITYGLSVWGKSNDRYLTKIYTLQKKVIRAITFSDFNAHTAPIFKKFKILKLQDLFNYKTTSLMWDYDHNTLPNSLASLFIPREKIHNRDVRDRNKNKLYTAHHYHNRYGFDSFTHHGAMLLNKAKDLPFYDNSTSKTAFLSKYKLVFLDKY